MAKEERIVLRRLNRPDSEREDDLISWFCKAFDFAETGNDVEPMLLKEIAKASFGGSGVSSKELNKDLGVPRSTVLYHINRFISVGFIVRKGTKYYLRSASMTETIVGIQDDVEREFNRMMQYAERLDKMIEDDIYGRRRENREGAGRVTAGRERAPKRIEPKRRRTRA